MIDLPADVLVRQIAAGWIGFAVAVAIVGLRAALSWRRSAQRDPGLTTEVALVLTRALGAMH